VAANRRNLKAVNTSRRTQPKRLATVADGGERDMLVVLRRRLAGQIDDPAVRPVVLSALVKQFRDVDAQIRALDAESAEQLEESDDGDGGGAAFDPAAI
jgi:hypothetical protein